MPSPARRKLQHVAGNGPSIQQSSSVLPLRSSSLAPAPTAQKHSANVVSSLPPSSPLPSSPKSLQSKLESAECGDIAEDPFGFLAVERRLKAVKPRKVLQSRNLNQDNAWMSKSTPNKIKQSVAASPGESDDGRGAFATPVNRTRLLSPISGQQSVTPTTQTQRDVTPRRRRRKTKLATSPSNPGTPASSSIPPTPSHTRHRQRTSTQETHALSSSTSTIRGDASGKDGRAETNIRDGIKTTEELQELLPRRPVRRSKPTARTKRSVKDKDSDSNWPKRSAKHRRKKSTQRKKTLKATEEPQEEGASFVLDDKEKEKYAIERAKRLEYFKNLDSYEVPKENVYVI